MNRKTILLTMFLIFQTNFVFSDAIRFEPEALEQDGKITLTPSFTPDGKTIYFAQSECSPIWECPQRLKTSVLGPDGWSKPMLVDLPSADRVDWPSVSPDGTTLIFSWAAPRADYKNLNITENFDLYTLDLNKPQAIPKPILGADINRPRAGAIGSLRYVHNEAYPSLTANGDLYFMTERLEGIGERDIYVAKVDENGNFQNAYPLPYPINTPNRDDGVWINPEGNIMLLSYGDRGGQGSVDIFVSRIENERWQNPINLGPTINSSFSDFGARLTPDGEYILFTSDRPFEGQPSGLLQVWIAKMP